MKAIKSISAVLLASALIFGISSCSNDDDSTDQSPKETESVSTTGIVTAATTNTSGQRTATLQASNGSYLFTETNPGVSANISYRAVVDESKGGTWTFTEKNASTAKYSGSYKGDISKFGNSEVKLSLTVEKILKYGMFIDVTNPKGFDFEASKSGFSAAIPSVEAKTAPTVTLPDSVGENPFAGKTFTLEKSTSEKMRTWAFTNDAATETYTRIKDGKTQKETSVYRYSYDANQKLLFLAFKNFAGEEGEVAYSFSSLAEYEEVLRKYSGLSEVELESELAGCAARFATMVVYQYEISENSISLAKYFNGSLPTVVRFSTETPIRIDYNDAIGMIYICLSDNTLYEFYPTFSGNSFIGKMYKGLWDGDKENRTSVGTVEGTYTTSGKGIKGSGCTITLIFTKLPDSVTGFTTGTEYVLKN